MAEKRLKGKKRKVAPMKAATKQERKIVLVGTYREGQLAWIKKNRRYNYPVREGDKFDATALGKVSELWLYAGTKATRHCYEAKFVRQMTREEWLKENPTYGEKVKSRGQGQGRNKAYYVFEVKPLEYGTRFDAPEVITRVRDFGGRSAKIKKAIEQYAKDGKFAPLAAYLPTELSQVPKSQLRVCEPLMQLDFCLTETNAVHVVRNSDPQSGCLRSIVTDSTIRYVEGVELTPIFFCGDSLEILRQMPEGCIDCCMTSPPYWNKRQYLNGGIGLEQTYGDYIKHLLAICREVYRVLKPTGSFWLNVGDSYCDKNLLNIPARIAIQMQDEQGWVLRNTIIWNKVKGCPDNSIDKLRNVYEPIFHFVKKSSGYYYDIDRIRNKPHETKVVNGAVVSATGVSGIKYKRKIELSTVLTREQKTNAMNELMVILGKVKSGEISDFRMIILGEQRTTHSDSEKVSGRAKELHEKGFYFLKYNPKGSKPSDLWDIIPEDSQGRENHFAPYPEDLCVAPLKLTCPSGGVVLDPFSGTGTTMKVARSLGMKSIGIDISQAYIDDAKKRISKYYAQGDLFEGGLA